MLVVNALNHIVEGQVCGIINRDCSPARSESFYTTSDDDGESLEDEMNKSEGESESHNRESTLSSSNMSQIILGLQIPPSPPLDITPSSRSSTNGPISSSSEQLMATSISTLQNIEASTSKQQQAQNPTMTKHQTGTHSLFYIPESKKIGQTEAPQPEMKEEFANPLCSMCKNMRPKVKSRRDYSYVELYIATEGFSQKNFLSEGGFGSVYKGQIDGMTIAVKQHKCASLQGEKEFKFEVNLLSKARHENVVMLLGSCSEGNNRLLVYEYICNDSLERHLSQHSCAPLSWEDRIKVAIGCAKGLLYLHENNIIHRDVRPNNILITHDHQPLLGDFGLARSQHRDSIHSTDVVGTLGYMAPEYAEYGNVSTKMDVYSFGVTLLELITGMRTTDQRLGGRSLVGWARPLLREKNYPDLIDERIMNSHDCHQLFWVVLIAEKCLSRDPHKRLNMAAVVNALNPIVEGQVCGITIRDSSPVRSDSFYTILDDDGESSEDEMNKSKGESESHNRESTLSSSNMSQIILGLRITPCPSLDITPSGTSSTVGKAQDQSIMDMQEQNEIKVLE